MKKDNFEQIFSEKLGTYEAPYNAEAWNNIKHKINSKPNGFPYKTVILITGIVLITTSILVSYYMTDETKHTDKDISIPNQKNTAFNEIELAPSPDLDKNSNTSQNHTENIENIANNPITLNEQNSQFDHIGLINDKNQKVDQISSEKANQEVQFINSETKTNYTFGKISRNIICLGESIFISNSSNKNEKVSARILGEIITIDPKERVQVNVTESTKIEYLGSQGQVIGHEEIVILESAEPSFEMDANLYEQGLPVAHFTTIGNFSNYSWDFGNGLFSNQKNPISNYFKKGNYNVKLTITDENGCVSTTSQQLTIVNDYNLLATNSIRLNDPDYQTRTFMPYCLRERGVPFVLTIMDPKDNSVVFTSSDIGTPWDGKDQRNGRMLPTQKTYVWQVQLEKIVPGEIGIYQGTVIIVE